MSQLFDRMVEREQARAFVWHNLAVKNGWICWMCGQFIECDDEVTYYLNDTCGLCEHKMQKDD
jgi:hypothetical protein